MTSRERIRQALDHKYTDDLPIDFGAMRSTGIQPLSYARLVEHLGLDDEKIYIYDIFQQLVEPGEKVVDRLGGDVLQVHKRRPAFGISIEEFKSSTLPDGTPYFVPKDLNPVVNETGGLDIVADGAIVARMSKDGFYFDVVNRIYENATTISDIEAIPLDGLDEADIAYMEASAKNLFMTTDKALLMEFGGNIFEAGQTDFGYETFFINMAIEQDLMHYYFNRLTERYISDLKQLMPRVHKYIDVIQFGDDLGTQIALQISKQMYREMIKPYHERIYGFIRSNYPDVKVFLHCCGAIYDLIPDLIDAGAQILNPVQISANGMDPVKLKRDFGKTLVFWGGGANMQKFVPNASIEQIQSHVAELIEIFRPGGGFVFNQVHNIQANVPPEKVMAIYDTALRYRGCIK